MLANGLTNAIRRKFTMIASVRKHSWGVRKHSRGLANIRNMHDAPKIRKKSIFATYL